jgi:hypothetical protein
MTGDILFSHKRSARKWVVVQIAEYKGNRFLDLRFWIGAEGELTATLKGVTLQLEAVPALCEALASMVPPPPPKGRKEAS